MAIEAQPIGCGGPEPFGHCRPVPPRQDFQGRCDDFCYSQARFLLLDFNTRITKYTNPTGAQPDGRPIMASDKKPESKDNLEPGPLQGRKFSLSEAIGRAGQGTLKGASPVSPSVQLFLGIQDLLETQLSDHEGSLTRTILAQFESNPPLLAQHHGQPGAALREYLGKVLGSKAHLEQLVRDTDARWGRDYNERPFFEKSGQPADPDDPYTNEKVRLVLKLLLDQIPHK
jgi:hypothetical protein